MPQDPFPSPEDDGEEPDRSVPPVPGEENEFAGPPGGSEQGLFVCLPAEELTLAGFAQDGRADTMAPGALLATLLDAITGEGGSGLGGLADDQLIGIISAARRMESRTAWTLMAALAELARRRPPTGEPADSGEAGFSDFAADEVAAELHLTSQSAAGQIWYAREVAGRLPRSFAALAAGLIHAVHLRIIQDETSILTAEQAAEADRLLAQAAQHKTFGELRYAAHRLVVKLDPDAARKRKESAAEHLAEVRRFREDSGNAGMIATELPCDEILASWQHVDRRACDLRAAGVPGTLRELRVRAFLDLLQERDCRLAPGVPPADHAGHPTGADGDDGPGGRRGAGGNGGRSPGGNGGPGGPHDRNDSRGPGGNGGSAGPHEGNGGHGPGRNGGPGSRPPDGAGGRARRDDGPSVAALVNLTVPLATALGLSATPGEAAGFGMLDGQDARDLLAAAARHPDTRWCVTALHPDGTAAAHGCARGRHPPPTGPPGPPMSGGGDPPNSGPDPPPGPVTPAAHGDQPDPDPPPGTANGGSPAGPDPPPGTQPGEYLAGLRIRMAPIARGSCDHPHAETGYRPSRRLAHLVTVRNARCTAPGCGRPAARCDLDHTLAWDKGGLTCECGLAPLCRHHHRCKQSQGWKLEQPSPGVLRWWTPARRSYATTPTIYPV